MTRETRTVFLSILTWLVYATSIFLNQGSLVFPFPLNELMLLIVSIQFFVWNGKNQLYAGILAVGAGLAGVIGTQYFWSFFYSPQAMQEFMKGLTTDYFQIAFYVIVLVAIIASSIKQKNGVTLLLSLLAIPPFLYGAWSNNALFFSISFGLMTLSTQLKPVFAPYHLLWVLLFILKISEWLTFILNNNSVIT